MTSHLLLRVTGSFSLTGLGVLLLGDAAAGPLLHLDLHTVWPVRLVWPDGSAHDAVASVEEVSRPDDEAAPDPARALLLTHEGAAPVPPGTRVYRLPEAPTT